MACLAVLVAGDACNEGEGAVVRQGRSIALVLAFLIGCSVLLVVGCSGTRSEAPKEKEQGHAEATKEQTRSPEATDSEEEAAVEAQAGSFDHHPPNPVLIKSSQVLQEGGPTYEEWWFYKDGSWTGSIAESFSPTNFPRAEVVRAGKLHIRLNKPQRPERFEIYAYPNSKKLTRTKLTRTLGRVERDGKTVGWDVYFRVKEPDRHYYLGTSGSWERVPGTHISYGEGSWSFHVKTR